MILLQIVTVNRESLSITSEFKLGLYVTRQLILRPTPNRFKFIQFTEIKIYSYIFKAQKRLNKFAATEITQTGYSAKNLQIKLIILCILRDTCHDIFCVCGDFYASGTQDAEATKSLVC